MKKRLSLYLVILIMSSVCMHAASISAHAAAQKSEQPLVTQEIRYRLPEAGEVFLLWGINGWQMVPEETRPAGTVVDYKIMHTPMHWDGGDTFTAGVKVPAGTTIDYVFKITKTRSKIAFEVVDTNGGPKIDYHTVAAQDGVTKIQAVQSIRDHIARNAPGVNEVYPLAANPGQTSELITKEFRYHIPDAAEVFLVWGLNGWQMVPAEVRPAGTEIWRNSLMMTPMVREDRTFIARVRVPAGATVDYGFQIRKKINGIPIKWIWDGDYRVNSSEDGVVESSTTLTMVRTKSLKNMRGLAKHLFAFIGAGWGIWLVMHRWSLMPARTGRGTLILLVNITWLAVFFILGEAYLRMNGEETYVRTFPGQYQNDPRVADWGSPDPLLGWTACKTIPEVNPQGFRDTKDFSAAAVNTGKTRVMVLGDSFMWGNGVLLDENVSNLLQARLGDKYEIFNVSAPGWGIDQMYAAYQHYRDVINPEVIVLAFIDDDINRVLESYRLWEGMNKPSFAVQYGQLVARPPASDIELLFNKLTNRSVFLSLIMQEIYLVRDAKPIVKNILLNMAGETRQKNRRFLVVRIPTRDHFIKIRKINRYLFDIEGMLKDTHVLYLDPSDEIRKVPGWDPGFYLDDGHFNAAGNQYLADYIFRQFFQTARR